MNSQNKPVAIPFFARANAQKTLNVRSGVKAGLAEDRVKAFEEANKR